jgi:endonuclease/exonuclease/phosphatase (EEP) superfamily protein YafD
MREFESVLKNVDAPCIIGGDFNVIEHSLLKPLSWLLGADIREALPWYNERAIWDTIFANAKLVNPLGGRVTHDFSRSQLDHIVVSDTLTATEHVVSPELAGSDHAPVFVEVSPHV